MSTGLELRRASTIVASASLAATLLLIPAQASAADATAAVQPLSVAPIDNRSEVTPSYSPPDLWILNSAFLI
jgi:hypothetical protein